MFGWFKKKKVAEKNTVPENKINGAAGDTENDAARLKKGLGRTRKSFLGRLDDLFSIRKSIDQDLFEALEEILITGDLGVGTTMELLEEARQIAAKKELSEPHAIKRILKEKIVEYLTVSDRERPLNISTERPFVIMVLGVNGVGKTTSIGKMANRFVREGKKVLLVAADTFRAAASEQLQVWGKRIGVPVVAKEAGADPSSVIYDALESEHGRNSDVIIVDTAGRMHTKVNLVEELKKIKRVMGKKIDGAPHEVMLVIDATTGQNAISQTKMFNEAVDVTGLTLTKLDGTAKGGIVINISREFDIPIRFIGIGEQLNDLRDFNPKEFAEALFDDDREAA